MRLSRVTKDLPKLTSLESDYLEFEPKTYRLDKQLRSLILTCEPQWQKKFINMDVALKKLEITTIKFTPEADTVKLT